MQDKVRVELLRQSAPSEGEGRAALAALQDAKQSGNMPDIEAAEQAYATVGMRWFAKIGEASFPVAGFELGLTEDGTPVVVLTVPASALTVDEMAEAMVQPHVRPAVPANQPRSHWGAPKADPRENSSGWTFEPPLGQQVADRAEQLMHAEISRLGNSAKTGLA
jgi:hypothetical protein